MSSERTYTHEWNFRMVRGLKYDTEEEQFALGSKLGLVSHIRRNLVRYRTDVTRPKKDEYSDNA